MLHFFMIRKILLRLVLLLPFFTNLPSYANDLLSKIRASGELTVGVKIDYPPWSMLNNQQQNVGFEPDLARKIARQIGTTPESIKVNFKAVSSANRFQKLNDKEVDLLIATVGDTFNRREQARMLLPHYFESGIRVLTSESSSITTWTDLIGEPVCLTAGAYFNKTLVQSYRIVPVILMNNRDAKLALLTNKCTAWAYDSGILFHLSRLPEWDGYRIALDSILPISWSFVTRLDAESLTFGDWLTVFLQDNYRSGELLKLAQEWQLPEREYLHSVQTLWQEKTPSGEFLCNARKANYLINNECADQPLRVERTIQKSAWPFDDFDTQRLIQSILHTVFFTFTAIILTLIFAALFSLATLKGVFGIGRSMAFLTSVQSTIPPILMLYLIYFGALSYWPQLGQSIWLSGAIIALFVLSLYTAAGINNLVTSNKQDQDNRSIVSLYVLHSVGVRANLVNLTKAAGMASVIASPNAVLLINSLISSSGNSLLLMSLLALFYYVEVMLFAALIGYVLTKINAKVADKNTYSKEIASHEKTLSENVL